MRVRATDANGDMVYGAGAATFLANSPQAVLQCVEAALNLYQGEWFLDTTAGMPWDTQVIGFETQQARDQALQTYILGVEGVTGISAYSSSYDKATRALSISAMLQTAYGEITLSSDLIFAPPPQTGYGVGGYGQNPYGV